jgi:hypothetical protein
LEFTFVDLIVSQQIRLCVFLIPGGQEAAWSQHGVKVFCATHTDEMVDLRESSCVFFQQFDGLNKMLSHPVAGTDGLCTFLKEVLRHPGVPEFGRDLVA